VRDIEALKDITLVVYDFDGVMTDNRVLVREDGMEAVMCNRSDGWGVGIIRRLGVEQVILSTEENPVVLARARKIRLEAVHGCSDKESGLRDLAQARGVPLEHILYVGNDTNDLGAMSIAGMSIAPADAHPDILAVADHITASRGGHGVVRELADHFIKTLT